MAEHARDARRAAAEHIGALDIVGDGFYAGSVGAAVVALYFLVVDALHGAPFFIPSLVGSVLLSGAVPGRDVPVDLGIVGIFSVFHGAAFVAYGTLCDWIVTRLREVPAAPLVALGCFVGLELGVIVGSRLLAPTLPALIGQGHIAAANVLAAIGMSIWLTRFARHAGDEA